MNLNAIIKQQKWQQHAACKGIDPSVFFPSSADVQGMRYALAICASCPVKAECLEAHLLETDGVWGGTSAKERQRIRMAREKMVRQCRYCRTKFVPANTSVQMCSDGCRANARRETRAKSKAKSSSATV